MDNHETESGSEFISPIHVRHMMRYVDALKYVKDGDVVIDAACGTGYGSYIISKKFPDTCVTGVDFCDEALGYARKNYENPNLNLRFEKHNLLLPLSAYQGFRLSAQCADVVLSIETIEHFEKNDIDKYVTLLLRLLRRGGRLVVSTPYSQTSGPSPITKQHLYEFNLGELINYLVSKNIFVDELKIMPEVGQAGRLGYVMLACTAP